ncbi:sugar kinase [Actinomadura harenae]|uniref:Sugar kinase n=1 Tax=Actinomadura harenae TaxID=2483351 RepID=A0A3M2M218_9ACTN|nr:sugar kinase [Actinomadura harenae]RMI42923.1 sugar kinase [Actinomadura harenae]
MTGPDVVGVGEAMVLLQPPAGDDLADAPALEAHVAGAELNACAAVARLGLRAAFASRVGDDPLGARVLRHVGALGVDDGLVRVDADRPTGVFFKDVRPDGRRRVHYYRRGSAASAMDESDADRVLAARARAVVLSGITVALGPGPAALVRRLAEQADGLVVLDPNLRPALGPVEPVAEVLRSLLPRVGLLALGTDEADALFGTDDPEAVFAAAREAGVGEVLLKAGPDGVWHASAEGPRHLPSAAVTVVDPVGAGDAMLGGYLAGRLSGASPAGAARLGTALAASVVASPGDTEGLPDAGFARAMLTASRG